MTTNQKTVERVGLKHPHENATSEQVMDKTVRRILRDIPNMPDARLDESNEATIRNYARAQNWEGLFGYVEILMAQERLNGQKEGMRHIVKGIVIETRDDKGSVVPTPEAMSTLPELPLVKLGPGGDFTREIHE